MQDECDLCRNDSAVLDFNQVCCRVRFVLGLPAREMRAEWLERWRNKDGERMSGEIEREVRERWGRR